MCEIITLTWIKKAISLVNGAGPPMSKFVLIFCLCLLSSEVQIYFSEFKDYKLFFSYLIINIVAAFFDLLFF